MPVCVLTDRCVCCRLMGRLIDFFFVLCSISGEREDRRIQQNKQMAVGISINILFSFVLVFVFKGSRDTEETSASACFALQINKILSPFSGF